MGNLMRRIRGVVKMGVVWAVGWGVAMATLFGMMGFVVANPGESRIALALQLAWRMGLGGAILGFGVGSLFGLTIAIAERSRSLAGLGTGRFAVWGALASSGLAAGAVALNVATFNPPAIPYFIAVSGIFGAASAAGLLKLAKRGAPPTEMELASHSSGAGLLYPSTQMPPERRSAEPVPASRTRSRGSF